ncbi:bestrophin-like domain [Xanthobacter pseudotagetidis]|uniref:bestrophin-like domain n=1 Tax=Xanthobacter pseudotagetidis TaxID=3119911 RepID=UPI003727F3B5
MSSVLVALIVFLSLFGGAMLGMWVARRLAEHHLAKETQDAVKLGVGMVVAVSSLILGLMTASVKGNFDATSRDVQQFATYLITLDGTLRDYGPPAEPARAALLGFTRHLLAASWQITDPLADGRPKVVLDKPDPWAQVAFSGVIKAIRALAPGTPLEVDLKAEALERGRTLSVLRWTVIEESVTTVPPIFTAVLIVWLTLIFMSFGLFAPVNRVSVVAFMLCAVCLAGAIFLILEMSSPFDGLIYVSPASMEHALAQMMKPA